MDADVYGPSIPRMMNLAGEPRMDAGKALYTSPTALYVFPGECTLRCAQQGVETPSTSS